MFNLVSGHKIQVKKLHALAELPAKGSPLASGFDIRACIDEPIVLHYGEPAKLIPSGLAIWMEPYTTEIAALLFPRSGLGHKQGLVLGNTIGVIDPDYQNEWFVSVVNRGNNKDAEGDPLPITINPGDRIAQALFVPVLCPEFEIVDDFCSETLRGLGGFGSTGNS